VIDACHELGISIALDDFGTGYSSLSYFKHLRVDVLKIDQSFVRDMLDDPDDLAILEGVLGLAKAFHRQAIAEGVETVEHGEMLLKLGCELAQGYGIARPMPASDLPAWVARWRPDVRWSSTAPMAPDDLPVLYAGVEHRAWVLALSEYLAGRRDAPPTMDHRQCRFGDWLLREGQGGRGGQPRFRDVEQVHREVHALAAEMISLQAAGHGEEALSRVPELHVLRDLLLQRLDMLIGAVGAPVPGRAPVPHYAH
ncbi:MAG: EAL domain-containing protein, partial [Burkholderiaceae bacterium]